MEIHGSEVIDCHGKNVMTAIINGFALETDTMLY
jgi:hypothetical protein